MIDSEAALEIARSRAAQKGWGFADPIEVVVRSGWFGSGKRFEISSNADKLGTKTRFLIDAATGTILSEGYISR
jgi:hypothetical protein